MRTVPIALLGCSGGLGPSEPPVLQNLIVAFDDYDAETGQAGAFRFKANEDKVFLEFNAEVKGPDGPKLLPTFEYLVDPSAEVVSPVSGTVTRFVYQEDTEDYEISIGSFRGIDVSIDHLTNVTFGDGDELVAGQVLGNPGTWSADLARTELMVIEGDTGHCPFGFFDPSLRSEYEARVTRLMADWEAFKGDPTIYDEEDMPHPGCNGLTWDDPDA